MEEGWECVESCPIRLLDEMSGDLHARGNRTPTKRRQSEGSWAAHGATYGIGPDGPIDSGTKGGASKYFQTFPPETEDNLIEPVQEASARIIQGDCVEEMRALPENSVDSVVCDPPYGLEFMGKEWDSFKTYRAGGNNMKPNGKAIKERDESWNPGANTGYRNKQPRCRRCGKLIGRGTGVCVCPEPIKDTRHAESGYQYQFWCEDWAREALRVLKPGGYLLAFGGTRTVHRLACAIEDAGFEIRDRYLNIGGDAAESIPGEIAWVYGSG